MSLNLEKITLVAYFHRKHIFDLLPWALFAGMLTSGTENGDSDSFMEPMDVSPRREAT